MTTTSLFVKQVEGCIQLQSWDESGCPAPQSSSSPLSESAGRWERPFLLINLLASNFNRDSQEPPTIIPLIIAMQATLPAKYPEKIRWSFKSSQTFPHMPYGRNVPANGSHCDQPCLCCGSFFATLCAISS